MGACDQKRSEEILDFFYQNGGNFIDTSNNYQFEQSEKIIGEWMKKRGNRDEMGRLVLKKKKAAVFTCLILTTYSCRNEVHNKLQIWPGGRADHDQLWRQRHKESARVS